MIEAFTAPVIALWHSPQVASTTRRSLGFRHMPAWACSAVVALAIGETHEGEIETHEQMEAEALSAAADVAHLEAEI